MLAAGIPRATTSRSRAVRGRGDAESEVPRSVEGRGIGRHVDGWRDLELRWRGCGVAEGVGPLRLALAS